MRRARCGAVAATLAILGTDADPEAAPRRGELRSSPPLRVALDHALPLRDDGGRDLIVLAVARGDADDPAEEPERTLVRWRDGDPPSWQTLLDRLPSDTGAIEAVDLDADGDEDLIVGRTGRFDRLLSGADGWSTELAPLLEDAAIDLTAGPFDDGPLDGVARTELAVTVLGARVTFGPGDDGWGRRRTVELPRRARRTRNGLIVTTPTLHRPRPAPIGGWLATEPEPHGDVRLRTWRVDTRAADPDDAVAECWAALPAAEEVLASHLLEVDELPHLLVLTRPADKLSLFGEKRLRLFPLRPDRTRAGVAPSLALETRINLWQEAEIGLTDVDGDDALDLVVAYWKGLRKTRVVLDVYRRLPDGSFATRPRTTKLPIEHDESRPLVFGEDLDGDGRADLQVPTDEALVVLPGAPAGSRAAVDAERAVELPMPPGTWATRTVDLDGDGTPEVLALFGDETDGQGFAVVRWPGAGDQRSADTERTNSAQASSQSSLPSRGADRRTASE